MSTSIESSLESKFCRFLLTYSMIIKIASIIFDPLNDKLSRSKALEKTECSNRTNSNSGAGFGLILDCHSRKNISDCNQSVYFFFKIELSYVN